MRHVMKLRLSERYELINSVRQKTGFTREKVADLLDVGVRTVARARAYCNDPAPLPRRGRPPVLLPQHIEYIKARTIANPCLTNEQLAKELRNMYPELQKARVHETTVMRARHELNLNYLPMRASCVPSSEAEKRRVKWCQAQQSCDTDWHKVVFTDESWFEMGTRKKYCWRAADDYRPEVTRIKRAHPPKVMIWAAIGYNFKGPIVFINDTVDADVYINDILLGSKVVDQADRAFGRGAWLFQQDNARPHISREAKLRMAEMGIKLLEEWPPYSPDLNIIERVWAIMKLRVDQQEPRTLQELKQIILDVWQNLTLETINSLVAEMPQRLIQVIANEGRTIHHI